MTPVTDLLFVYGTLQREGAAHYLLAGKVTLLGVAWIYLYNRLTDSLVPVKNGCWLPLR
jgi:gamma-glutamylcyclotransferase (GGCT)/AIG2-like uncharacterized protein YtfP